MFAASLLSRSGSKEDTKSFRYNGMDTAETYDVLQYSRQGSDGMVLIEKLNLKDGMNVLDLGCGTGLLASVIAKRIGESGMVTAVDPDKDRIKIAREKYGSQKNLKFLEGSSENFPGGPYDIVFSNHVLHSIKEKSPLFRKIFDELRVDGRFAFLCSTRAPSSVWEIVTPRPDQDDYMCTNDVYDSLARQSGFVVEHHSVDEIAYAFDDVQQYIDFVLVSVHVNAGKAESSRLSKLKERYGNGKVSVECTRVMYVLQK